jgi:DNA polymerase III gamma/tau subunit
MPLYDFKNIETDELEEHMVKISEYDQFLLDNTHLQRVYTKVASVSSDGGRDVLSRAGDGWKEVQDKIRSGMPPADRHLIETK